MTNAIVTNGTVKYGRTIKTGDFESKRGDCELSFTVPEGSNANEAIAYVEGLAIKHVFDILGHRDDARPVRGAKEVEELRAKVDVKKAPKMLAPAKAAPEPVDASEMVDDTETPAFLKGKADRAKAAAAEEVVEDEGLGDLLGGGEVKEITDKELTDATQKCQSMHNNAPAIRKILGELGVKTPPGRIIDLPQEKRQQYLDRLLEVKPLA